MRKIIIPLLLMIMLSTSVLAAWSASRAITGNDVVITITPGDGFDTFTVTEIVLGATIVDKSFPNSCSLAKQKLTCDFDGTNPGTILYKTTGAGKVAGSVAAVNSNTFAKETKAISGDSQISSPPSCEDKDGDGYGTNCAKGLDCNDNDAHVNPGVTEVCNGIDDNCSPPVDEGFDFNTDKNNCGACGVVCGAGELCSSGLCAQQQQQQEVPTCNDGKQNGNEADVDCGGPACEQCVNGKECSTNTDCKSDNCDNGVCKLLIPIPQLPPQQDNQALLDAISNILQGKGTTLEKLSSIAAQLYKFFNP